MTTIAKTILSTGAIAILALTGMVSAVEARDGQQSGARKHDGVGLTAGNRVDRRGKTYRGRGHDRSVGRALRGVVIIGEESRGCSYAYRRWQATGSRYWRSRYYDCRG